MRRTTSKHDALLAAVKTEPTTVTGWAVKLDFLATDPDGTYPGFRSQALCARADEDDEWQDAICGALTSAAEMLRHRATA
jgi:hypothetical protein